MNYRTGIGGNSPPPLEALSLHIEDLFSLASGTLAGGDITTDEQEAAIADLLEEMRKARKDADQQRAADKKPHLDDGKAIDAAWKPAIDRAAFGEGALKGALTLWRTAQQRAKDEAAAQARADAEAAQKAAQEALKASDDIEAQFAAELELDRAAKLTAQANRIDKSATGLRTYQIAEVTDAKALLQHVMRNDPFALKDWLADYARKALPAQLPGVTIQIEKRAA